MDSIKDIANNSIRSPFSIQSIIGGSNNTARSSESVDSSNTALGTEAGTVIAADTLGRAQATPDFTPAPVRSSIDQQISNITQQAGAIQERLDQRRANEEAEANDPRNQIQAGITDLLNRDTAGDRQRIRDNFRLAEKEELSRELANSITETRRDFEQQVRDLKQNPNGKGRGALQADLNDLTEKGNLILSEKAFQYSIVNGDFQAAQTLANQQLADMEKAEARQLNLFKTAYDFVQDDLSESEKLQVQQQFQSQEADRKLQRDQVAAQFKFDLEAPQRQFENSIKQGQLNVAIQKLNQANLASQQDVDKAVARLQGRASTAEIVIKKVDEALTQTGGFGATGFLGGSTQKIPGTAAFNTAQTIQTIKANLGFAELQSMRENSPTGGALGQVAVQELEALQSTIANLAVGQSKKQLDANLIKIRGHYEAWLETVGYSVAPDGDVIQIID